MLCWFEKNNVICILEISSKIILALFPSNMISLSRFCWDQSQTHSCFALENLPVMWQLSTVQNGERNSERADTVARPPYRYTASYCSLASRSFCGSLSRKWKSARYMCHENCFPSQCSRSWESPQPAIQVGLYVQLQQFTKQSASNRIVRWEKTPNGNRLMQWGNASAACGCKRRSWVHSILPCSLSSETAWAIQ